MRRQAVSVRAGNELERLPLEHGRTGVARQPRVGKNHELHAHQLQSASRQFVDQHLRLGSIEHAVADQGAVDVVKAHGSMIRAADAAEERLVTGGGGGVDVDELPGGVATTVARSRYS